MLVLQQDIIMPTHSALFTDQYEIVMAYGYWQMGMAEKEAMFYLSYRTNPFKGNYAVACGLETVIDYIKNYRFTPEDIEYLANQLDPNGTPLFPKEFLVYLRSLKLTCDIDAIPEGTLVFPHQPILRIKGPILQCQLLETALINFINLPTLIATKASRIRTAAQNDNVVEFGVRRAQGPDGGITATRAAYIGGCDSTSHVLAGQLFDIPIKGTQAHSWVMAFDKEIDAFRSFSELLGDNTTLLVDTYHTETGIKNAIKIGQELRESGRDLAAIRLDSGDLVELSNMSRKMLDEAGFTNTKIFASGDLDENIITELKQRGANIDAWGVGTRLSTSYDQPALNTIYKLCAIRDDNGNWDYRLKISDQPDKTTMAGIVQVRRYGNFDHDLLYDEELGTDESESNATNLLTPIFRNGVCVYEQPSIHDIRQKVLDQITTFNHLDNTHYEVKIDNKLNELQVKLGADSRDNI